MPDAILDIAWAEIHALGYRHKQSDAEAGAYNEGIRDALDVIEALGGRDPCEPERVEVREHAHA